MRRWADQRWWADQHVAGRLNLTKQEWIEGWARGKQTLVRRVVYPVVGLMLLLCLVLIVHDLVAG